MPISNAKEEIDIRILRLIGLDDVFDLDYGTYLTLLKEAMVKGRMPNTTIPSEEVELLTNEYKRVKTKKDSGRFEVKKKKISATSFGIGDINGKIIGKSPIRGLLPAKAIAKSPLVKSLDENISAITSAVISISETLKAQKKISDDSVTYDRKKAEQDKRALAESNLEKRFEGLKKVAEKIIAPVKSILDRIIEFLTTVLLGRIVFKLIEWWGDPKNADKVRSIIRFFGDHWPKLLALYLTFGTSLGRFALGLTRAVARGAIKLLAKIAMLAAAKKMRGARGVARFLGGGKGKIAANVIGTGLALGGAYALTQGLKGGGGEEEQKTQKFSGGGYVRPKFPAFNGGGLNFAGLGNMFGSLGTLFGGASESQQSGFVSGEKGVDKVPAMLSDGEFVMSRGAVAKYGVDTLEAMNAAGGGTNKPKIMSGTTYAAGGGFIGGIDERRRQYDTMHGAGAYDKESQRRKNALASEEEAKANKKGVYIESPYVKELRSRAQAQGTSNYMSLNGIKIPSMSFDPKIFSPKSGMGSSSYKPTPEQQRAIDKDNAERSKIIQQAQQKRSAEEQIRKEWNKAFKDPSHPLHEKAAFDDKYNYSQFKKDYLAKQATSPAPYQSRFAGARDAAFAKAKMIGGFTGIKSQDFYKGNSAAKEKQLSGLTSQQRLNKLSYEGAYGRSGTGGRRFVAEDKARKMEFDKRGGLMGQLGRLGTRMFGGEQGRHKLAVEDSASSARVKQSGAASIGRYYSSSDGKYYKDYNAAVKAKKIRLAQQQKKSAPTIKPPVKPQAKYNPAGGGMGGARGAKGSNAKPKIPNFSATTKGMRSKQETLGLMR